MKTKGFYAEMDPDLASKLGLKPITNEKKIREIIGKSDIEMTGNGTYTRNIGAAGKKKEKVLVGLPK
jgi:hypothetical protein